MSENKKMPSPYAVLGNRPIDQWKVTELKEELKKRKLSTKGLKEELVKRLDEAVRSDNEDAQMNDVASLDSASQAEVQSENAVICPSAVDTTDGILDNGENITDKLDIDNETVDCGNNEAVSPSAVDTTDGILDNGENLTDKLDIDNETVDCGNNEAVSQKVDTDVPQADVDGGLGSLAEESIGEFVGETNVAGAECLQVVEETSVETTVTVETAVTVSESVVSETAFSGQDLQNSESEIKYEVSNLVQDTLDSKPPHEELKLNSSDVNIQVAEASQVKSDSISIDTVSITEKNELKDSVIADDVILEVDVIPAQPSSNNPVLDGGNLQPIDIDEPHSNKVTVGNNDVIKDENADTGKKIVCGDVGSPEKLNLDRSSGDDSMEEDPLESKQVDSKLGSDDISDKSEKVDASVDKEDTPLDAMVEDTTADKKIVNVENQNGLAAASVKRKLHEQEAAGNTDLTKRQRRWNSESLKVPEPQGSNISASNTPKDAVQPAIKRNFSRSNSAVADETPKERVVPPSPKTPTNSLRIDRFLRPFTLKAVQELLGKTGSVTSFWMDHIKTHCYVTYSSIEEAIETRNAVYNLQWPTNGGRLLLAEFVDPQEVKNRLEAPLPSPTTPASTTPTLPPPPQAPMQPPQPSPRLQVQRQQQQLPPPPPLPLPPPPPLSNPPLARERLLPPPPPLPEKVDPPIVTLDDLFRKTRATPRIYYLPLSEEQVAEKLKAHGKTTKQ